MAAIENRDYNYDVTLRSHQAVFHYYDFDSYLVLTSKS